MSYCIIDTETSGLFDFKLPAHAEGQPRLASLSMIFTTDDLSEITGERRFFVKPDGWEMSDEVTAINGLSTEYLRENGVDISEVLHAYETAVLDGSIIGAFNAQFDTKVMRGELRRAGRDDLFERTPNVCAMRAAAAVIPGKGRFVSLKHACGYFGIENVSPHDASSDAMACLEVMRALLRGGALPEPKIAYAKTRPERVA